MVNIFLSAKRYLEGASQFENYYSYLITMDTIGLLNFSDSKIDFIKALDASVNIQINII